MKKLLTLGLVLASFPALAAFFPNWFTTNASRTPATFQTTNASLTALAIGNGGALTNLKVATSRLKGPVMTDTNGMLIQNDDTNLITDLYATNIYVTNIYGMFGQIRRITCENGNLTNVNILGDNGATLTWGSGGALALAGGSGAGMSISGGGGLMANDPTDQTLPSGTFSFSPAAFGLLLGQFSGSSTNTAVTFTNMAGADPIVIPSLSGALWVSNSVLFYTYCDDTTNLTTVKVAGP